MTLNKTPSQPAQKTSEQKPGPTIQKNITHFGYKKIPEGDKVKWVLRHFNTVAEKYDFMNTLLSFGIHHLWKQTAIRMLELRKGHIAIDVCGGTGDLSLLAAKEVSLSGKVVLYDMNESMMARARPKIANSPFVENIFFVQGNAEQISFSDRSFDAAIVGFGIRNLTHWESGLREMHRVLKPGGKMVCLEFSKPTFRLFRWLYDFYSFQIMPILGQLIVGSKQAYTYLPESIRMFPLPDELADILRSIGFSNVKYRRLTNGIAVVHFGTKE